MKKLLLKATLVLTANCLLLTVNSSAQIITTIAGNGIAGWSGNGGIATAAELDLPSGMTIDVIGNIYFADINFNFIRKINTAGIITVIAGTGTQGFSGDGGQATAAELGLPSSVAIDAAGNLYIADQTNNRIRKVNTAGIITTVAGSNTQGFSGDGGQATAAELHYPQGITCDAAGNLYIADVINERIRLVNTAGIISTYAGNGSGGYSGDGGQATAAELYDAFGVAIDAAGNLYIADENNNRVRKVNTAGIITTVAGNGTAGFSGDGGQATNAKLSDPWNVAIDAYGNLYISDSGDGYVRKVNSLGIITTIAGNGIGGYSGDGGQATNASLSPDGIVIDALNNVYIADRNNNRIRMICNAPDNVSGIITAPSAAPITAGKVYVYRPNPIHNGLLDTAGYTTIQANGAYTFTNLPYANYYIEAKADTNVYPTAVGTYYSTKTNNYPMGFCYLYKSPWLC